MLYCKKCKHIFERAEKTYESHSLSSSPYEVIYTCPNCKSDNITESIPKHCRCCGVKFYDGIDGYCSVDCKIKGEKLRKIQEKRRKIIEKSPLNELVKEVDEYNRKNQTNYSYGQYVAFIIPKEKLAKRKCTKQKRNI